MLHEAMEKMVSALSADHEKRSGTQQTHAPLPMARKSVIVDHGRDVPPKAQVLAAEYQRTPLPMECTLFQRPVFFYLCHQTGKGHTRMWVEAEYPVNALRTSPWLAQGRLVPGYRTSFGLVEAFLEMDRVPTDDELAKAAQNTVEWIRSQVQPSYTPSYR